MHFEADNILKLTVSQLTPLLYADVHILVEPLGSDVLLL